MKTMLIAGSRKKNPNGADTVKLKINELCIICGVRYSKDFAICPTCKERLEAQKKVK